MSQYIPLSKERFADHRWDACGDYRHAEGLTRVPVAAPEIGRCAAHLPLAFARDETGKPNLYALTGLVPGKNHCLDAAHKWTAGYVPSFLRTHPFQLLRPPEGKGKPDQMVLCVDAQSPWVSKTGSNSFFDGDGMDATVAPVFQFLTRMTKHYLKTAQAVAALDSVGLLADWPITTLDSAGSAGLLRVNDAAMNKLTGEQLARLQQCGALSIAYAQMLSTHQLPRLQALAAANHNDFGTTAMHEVDDDAPNTFAEDGGDFDLTSFLSDVCN